jgi:hypothetical protein
MVIPGTSFTANLQDEVPAPLARASCAKSTYLGLLVEADRNRRFLLRKRSSYVL